MVACHTSWRNSNKRVGVCLAHTGGFETLVNGYKLEADGFVQKGGEGNVGGWGCI